MNNQHPPIVEKALNITEKYIAKFGKTMIGVYQSPEVERKKFVLFQDALQTALRRNDLLPCYLWMHSKKNVYYLVLWVQGYFRNDMSDIIPVINHLWPLYSPYLFRQLETIPINSTNCMELKRWLLPLLLALGGERVDNSKENSYLPHQRSFGSSPLR